MKLSIVLPCYNEEQNIPRIVPELFPVLEKCNPDFEVVIVDDGSRDGSVDEIKKINDERVCLVEHDINQGLGAAIRTGIANATGDYLITMDTDFTFHPNLIPVLLTALNTHPEVDFVIGSPNLGGYDVGIPGWRMAISKSANRFYRFLLGRPATSINQIFRLYKIEQLKSLPLEAIGFDINTEILFRLVFCGKRFVEVPAELTQRLYGVSKLNYYKEIRRHLVLICRVIKWKWFANPASRENV